MIGLLLILSFFQVSSAAPKADRIVAEQKKISCSSKYAWKGEGGPEQWQGERNLVVRQKGGDYEVVLNHTGLQKNSITVVLPGDSGRWMDGLKGVQLKTYPSNDHKVIESGDLLIKDTSYQLVITKRFFMINDELWGEFNQVIRCKLKNSIKF